MCAFLCTWSIAVAGPPGDRINIVGSYTVFPFSTLVAAHFAKSGFTPPSVTATSTSEGFRLFCAGAGADTPDINNASRPISAAEKAACARNGIKDITEVRIGYDSLILATSSSVATFDVTRAQLWRAVAQRVPINGRWQANPYHTWHQIDAGLPDRPIKIIGPAPEHGTRDAFIELVMEPSCNAALHEWPEMAGTAIQCGALRSDGAWSDLQSLELILGKLASNPDTMGITTYSYLEHFGNRIRAASVDGIAPTRNSIPNGAYPLSRPLLIYLKDGHLKTVTGLADFATEFVSLCAAGAHGYLADEGLVPLPMPELMRERAAVARLQR
jgi:phosphate transport system substrate-binding protein